MPISLLPSVWLGQFRRIRCLLGLEHQFHMGTRLCEIARGGTYMGEKLAVASSQAEEGGFAAISPTPVGWCPQQ